MYRFDETRLAGSEPVRADWAMSPRLHDDVPLIVVRDPPADIDRLLSPAPSVWSEWLFWGSIAAVLAVGVTGLCGGL
jgi:hypothetical protein